MVQTYVKTCKPMESPRFCQRQNHPPLARGAYGRLLCMNWLSVNHTFLVGEDGFDLHFRRGHLLEIRILQQPISHAAPQRLPC